MLTMIYLALNVKRAMFLTLLGIAVGMIRLKEAAVEATYHNNNPEPFFVEPIGNQTTVAGRSASLKCVVENLGTYKVAWMHTDKHALLTLEDRVITRNHRYHISHNAKRSWWLHIKEVEEEDRGQYMCQINTSPMKSQVGYLDVVVPPRIDESNTSSDAEVREGKDASLRCHAKGWPQPNVKWRREDDRNITLGSKKAVPSVAGEFLNLTKVSRIHMGAYLCIASNGVQAAVSKRIMLSVLFSPMIWISSQLVGAPIGTDVVLDCSLECYPRAVTFWNRDGGIIILANNKYDIYLMETGIYKVQMKLRIKNLNQEDFGSYTCVAKNSLGETEGTIRLYEVTRQTTSPTTQGVQSSSNKLDGPYKTSSEKVIVGTWQNSVNKFGRNGKKYEFPTEALEAESSINIVSSDSKDSLPEDITRRNGDDPNSSPYSSTSRSWSLLALLSLSLGVVFLSNTLSVSLSTTTNHTLDLLSPRPTTSISTSRQCARQRVTSIKNGFHWL